MIAKTPGIVLSSIKYGETSLVCRILTREFGLQSYLVKGVRKARPRIPQNLFQPATLLELVAYQKEQGGLQHIREIFCPAPFSSIPYNILKTSIAIFLSELLLLSLKESDSSPGLFDFVKDSFQFLDRSPEKVSDFHLLFMLKLAGFLGFAPRDNYDSENMYFNLREGEFQRGFQPSLCLDQEQSRIFQQLATAGFHELQTLNIRLHFRRELLHRILDFYRMHLEGLRQMHSHYVLEEVLG